MQKYLQTTVAEGGPNTAKEDPQHFVAITQPDILRRQTK